ncbi:hypothetical protein D3C87_80180 [compost metagenome]
MIEKITKDLYSDVRTKKIIIEKVENKNFDHVIVAMDNDRVAFRQVLVDAINNKIFLNKEINEKQKREKLKRLEPKIVNKDDLEQIEKGELNKLVQRAVKQCVNDHGPITKEFISSAAKRITGEICGLIKNKIYVAERNKSKNLGE